MFFEGTAMQMNINNFDALLFDCDGVIAETERDAHRISFNQAFRLKGLTDVEWGVEEYGRLLKIGGGKERMRYYFDHSDLWSRLIDQANLDESHKEEMKRSILQDMHFEKTNLFKTVIEAGYVPARPGVLRLIDQALENNIQVAICSTSNEDAVRTIGEVLLGLNRLSSISIFAGDIVTKKKPAPDIYQLAANTLNINPSRCWVVEDTEIGLKAALAAGMKCCITKSIYSQEESFVDADIVVSDLDSGLDGPVTLNYLDFKAKALNDRSVSKEKKETHALLFGKEGNYGEFINKFKEP